MQQDAAMASTHCAAAALQTDVHPLSDKFATHCLPSFGGQVCCYRSGDAHGRRAGVFMGNTGAPADGGKEKGPIIADRAFSICGCRDSR
jgi:hypothetical protein